MAARFIWGWFWSTVVAMLCMNMEAWAEPPTYKVLGDETNLVTVKSSPQDYFRKPIFLMGKIAIDDYYNYAYDKAKDTHYSLSFHQLVKSVPVGVKVDLSEYFGEDIHLYLSRAEGKQIADTIIQSTQKDGTTPYKIARVKVALQHRDSGELQWDFMELLDIQFADENKEWQGWALAGAKEKQQKITAENDKKQAEMAAEERQALDARRTRTWKDSGKPFVGKFVGMEGGTVTIETEKRTLRVPLFRLSKEDRDWVRNETKK